MSDILCIYSSPGDLPRLRIDEEHRTIDRLLERLNLPAHTIQRHQAATVQDVVGYLNRDAYDIVQISSHGDESALVVEDEETGASIRIGAGRLAELIARSQPGL